MSRLADFYNQLRGRYSASAFGNPYLGYFRNFQALYDSAHGGEKYALSKVPIFGEAIKFRDDVQRYNDQYARTGRDSPYASRYAGADIPGTGGLSSALQPVKMAKSLAKMYGADVQLEIAQTNHAREKLRGYNDRRAYEMWSDYQRRKANNDW